MKYLNNKKDNTKESILFILIKELVKLKLIYFINL